MDPLTIGNESPSARQSILGSFLRARPRGTSQSHPSPPHDLSVTRDSPPPPATSLEPAPGHRRRPAAAAGTLQSSVSQNLVSTPTVPSGFTQMLRRRRSAGTLATNATPQLPAIAVAHTIPVVVPPPPPPDAPTHRIRLVPHLDSRRSLRFDPICRDVREGDQPLRIGRFTDRSSTAGVAAANASGSNKLAFKSKVVSRAHAEIWAEPGGKFYIKDTKSSSGTFLNHVRLSAANTESRANELKDGDMLQLGVDYQGGTEDIYKCVKIKIEMGREWQAHSNPFNANALKQLKAIAIQPSSSSKKLIGVKSALPDCCICLFAVTIHQALFIAPCSHAFHYKCLRPLLETHHPAFSCPLCRTFANLDEDVEVELDMDHDSIAEASSMIASVAAAIADRPAAIDAGAETEVEPDTGASRLGTGMRNRRAHPPLPSPGMPDVVDLTEDADQEMDDLVLPPLPEGSPQALGRELFEDVRMESREPSVSPVPVLAGGSGDFDVEEGDASAEGASDGSGSGSGADNAANGKRKR